MIRLALILSTSMLAACASNEDPRPTISSMNFVPEKVDLRCALSALRDAEGFSVQVPPVRRAGADQFTVFFNDTLPVQAIIRHQADGSSEVSVFVKLEEGYTPLDRRKADFAVRRADEAIYRVCTEDGRTYGQQPDIILEPKIQSKEENGS